MSVAVKPELIWQVKGLGVSASISEALLGRLHAWLDQTPGGMEFGGILLGRVLSEGGRYRTEVTGFEPFPIEYRRGESYTVSVRDERLLERRLQRLRRIHLVPVGFCRSHRRRGLYLDQQDFALFRQEFRHPSSLFLLVRRDDEQKATGAVFVWEEEDVRRHASYQEFALPPAVPAPEPFPIPKTTVAEKPERSPWQWRPAEILAQPDLLKKVSALSVPALPIPELRVPKLRVPELRVPELRVPELHLAPGMTGKVVLTVALPLFAFFAAREIASLRTLPAEVAQVRPIPQPATESAEADRVVSPVMERKPDPFPEPPAPVVSPVPNPPQDVPRVPAETRPTERYGAQERAMIPPETVPDVSGTRPAPVNTPTVNPAPAREVPALPDPPLVAPAHQVASLPHVVAATSGTTAHTPPKVVAYIKPEPASGVRSAIQKVFAGRTAGDDIVAANPLEHPLPPMPRDLRRLEQGSTIEMLAKVDRHGNVVYVKVVEGNRELADTSANTLLRWHFDPARRNGNPVDSAMRIRFEFRGTAK